MGGSTFLSFDQPPLSVQLNEFTLGDGCAVAVTMSHKLADGTSFAEFLKAWADTARACGVHARPKFESAALFPPQDVMPESMPVAPSMLMPARLLIRGEQLERAEEVEVERYMFTSWCRFPFYETDFGWGGPAWVASPPYMLENFFLLMSARGGDGFEVWAFLTEEEMEGFANDPELLAFTSSPATSVHALGS
ncbi:Deacetylvindoline O-acetyltransferase [Acorus calamus]|uniref:Deacetylvindoline O-acetyltransferase n=1 Tax=Acorus calamus TaxID=4465 RepID=A0AAV9D1F2_ACOCL|nr:Deacetylvindoline O-acetyltransferase [Acorus calamus]